MTSDDGGTTTGTEPSPYRSMWGRPTTYLRLVFLLLGSALAVSFLLLDITLVALVADFVDNLVVVVAAGVLIVGVPPVVLALMPPVRQVEAVAAQTLLGVRFPDGLPGPPRTWEQRVRAAAWFFAHLATGTVVAVVVVLFLSAVPGMLAAPLLAPGTAVVGVDWVRTRGDASDAWLVLGGLVLLVVTVAVVVLLGAGMARLAPVLLGPSYAERLHRLEAETARLAERNRIARELHDSVGHALSLVTLQSAAAKKVLHRDPEFVARALEAIESATRSATADLDHMLGLLRAPDEAVRREPSPDLRSLPALVAATRTAGLDVAWRGDGSPDGAAELSDTLTGLPSVVSREAYRIVQEGLTNALRYASGSAQLRLERQPDRLVIEIQNPVAGRLRRRGRRPGTGRGLSGINERVDALGGTVYSGVETVGDDTAEPVDSSVEDVDKGVDDAMAAPARDAAVPGATAPAGSRIWRLRVELPLIEKERR